MQPKGPLLGVYFISKNKARPGPDLIFTPAPSFPVDITRPSLPFGFVRREMVCYMGGGECKQGTATGCSGIIMLYIIYYINAGNHDVTTVPFFTTVIS